MLICDFCGNAIYENGDGATYTRFTFINRKLKRWAHENCLETYNLYIRSGYSDFCARFFIKHTANTEVANEPR